MELPVGLVKILQSMQVTKIPTHNSMPYCKAKKKYNVNKQKNFTNQVDSNGEGLSVSLTNNNVRNPHRKCLWLVDKQN